MAYTALYRKYRPAEFEEVKGQDHIVTTLKNQIKADRIGHAYLFCGTRGTGKTTVAKIFAKAVNCQHPVDGSPCGECACCRAIANGSSMNVIEIDAASNNGVDNIRQIREEVSYPPTEGRFRVYIIDEVHMLSTGAFNALLKTLEEPPSYVIFILATTEAHKIPITVLSRCQRYDFHRITIDTIASRLQSLMELEGIETEEKAIRYIARAGDGSMRDALSLLDQCVSFYIGKKLTYENVLEVLGVADTTIFSGLMRCILADDVSGAIRVVEQMVEQGRELGQFVTDFIWYMRNLLLVQASDQMEDILDMSSENLALLKEEAGMLDAEVIMRYIRVFSELAGEMKYSSQKRVLLEIAVIRLCRPAMEDSSDALIDRIGQLERKMEQGIPMKVELADLERRYKSAEPEISREEMLEKARLLEKALPEDIKEIIHSWQSLTKRVPAVTRQCLDKAILTLGEDNKLILVFDEDIAYNYVAKEEHLQTVRDILAEETGKDVELAVKYTENDQTARRDFIDLKQLIHMDVEVDDSEEDLF